MRAGRLAVTVLRPSKTYRHFMDVLPRTKINGFLVVEAKKKKKKGETFSSVFSVRRRVLACFVVALWSAGCWVDTLWPTVVVCFVFLFCGDFDLLNRHRLGGNEEETRTTASWCGLAGHGGAARGPRALCSNGCSSCPGTGVRQREAVPPSNRGLSARFLVREL